MLIILICLTIIVGVAALMGPAENKKVCVILNESTASEWSLLKEGLKQAADEYSLNLFIQTTDRFLTADDMEKVILNAAQSYDGLVVGMESFLDGQALMDQLPRRLPVVFLNGTADAGTNQKRNAVSVSVDDYEMGRAIAQVIKDESIQTDKEMSVGIIMQGDELISARDRVRGLTENIAPSYHVEWEINLIDNPDLHEMLQTLPQTDCLVSMDNATTEDVALYLSNREKTAVRFYGVGYSTDAVYYLDHGQIAALAVPDEYNIGFSSIQLLASYLYDGNIMRDQTEDFKMIMPDMIFNDDIRDFLFPVSQ